MITQHRKIWYLISGSLFILSLILIFTIGLPLGIDFTGGNLAEVSTNTFKQSETLRQALANQEIDANVQATANNTFIIKYGTKKTERGSDQEQLAEQSAISQLIGEEGSVIRFETVGPTISRDLQTKAIKAIILASVCIIIYLAWAFRKTRAAVSAWSLGVIAVLALIHDLVIITGSFSLLGYFFNQITVDVYFITALLTILGYSVNDTIVVFDRLRETLRTKANLNIELAAERSIRTTLPRSLNTSLTVLIVLLTLLVIGGGTLFSFLLALTLGVIIGTYSSIFVAAPLIVSWHNFKQRRGVGK